MAPQKWRKKLIFEANLRDLVHSVCLSFMLEWQGRIQFFFCFVFIRGAPKLRTKKASAPVGWVQGVSKGDVPPSEVEKKLNF